MDTMCFILSLCFVIIDGFLGISVVTSSPINFKEQTWKRNVCLEEKNLTGVVSMSSSTSLVMCASFCSSDEKCVIFNFNQQHQKCHAFTATDDKGMKYASNIEPAIYNHVFRLTVHNNKKNFTDASSTCAAECKRLLVLDTAEKLNYILSRGDLSSTYWIGVTDQETEGQWLWVDGSKFLELENQFSVEFNNYDGNMKDNRKYNADCAVMRPTRSDMFDVHCSKLYIFICETY